MVQKSSRKHPAKYSKDEEEFLRSFSPPLSWKEEDKDHTDAGVMAFNNRFRPQRSRFALVVKCQTLNGRFKGKRGVERFVLPKL